MGRSFDKTHSSPVSSKGQVTIPQEIRERLGLRAGDRVEFVVKAEETVIRPARARDNPFDEYIGILPAFKSIDEINAWVRELRGDDAEEP